ncbi:NACHT domain-containing protein [Phormidesmis priestleyi]
MSFDFSLYLESICRPYAQWWQVYTLTDVVGQTAQREATLPLLGLMVQTVAIDKHPKHNESKVERFTVLEGARKYAAEHVLLVGRPGSGKSTALARLLLEEAQKAQQDSSALIPVLVELRYYKTSVLELVRSFLQSHDLRVDRSDIETLLFQRRFLLLMDGLNELPSEEARREVKAFRQTYRKTPTIFTTRDLGIGGDLNLTRKLEMQPLTEKQMQQFVRSYLPAQGDALLRQLGDYPLGELRSNRLRELGQTPLLLWMLCSVFENNRNRMPSNLGSVFRQFTQIYDRKLKDDVPTSEESRRWWDGMLRSLAWGMMQGKSLTELQVAVDRDKAEQWLTAFLTGKVPYPESCAKQWLDDLLKHHLIQLGTGTQIEFRHQLIQEYYAAEQLLKQLPQLNNDCLKWDYLNYLKWTEPIALMLELVEDEPEALRVVRLALEVDLMLGAKLAGKVKVEWQEGTIEMVRSLQLPQLFEIQLLGVGRSEAAIPALTKWLKDENSFVRRSVAEALGKIGSQSAIPALIELLKDENSFVRRSVAEALGKIGSQRAIPALVELLKDEDILVRSDAADALDKIDSKAEISASIETISSLFKQRSFINTFMPQFMESQATSKEI